MPQSPSKYAWWDLTQFSQLPSAAPSYFPESHWRSQISSLSKVILGLGKARSHRVPNLGCGELGYWVTWVIWCLAKKPYMRRDAWEDMLSWWSCQSPVTHNCGLLNHLNNFHGGLFKLDAKFDVHFLLCLLSHFECHSHTVHVFIQWRLPPPLTSTMKSSLFTHMHSIPLSLAARLHPCCANRSHYSNNGWTFSRQTLYACFNVLLLVSWNS